MDSTTPTAITNGVKVSVKTFYIDQQKSKLQRQYVFAYRVFIENCSAHTIQLKRRHWHIFDANGKIRQVEGVGVAGEQPILEPNEIHQYDSWTYFTTPIGKMNGTFLMQRLSDDREFEVVIPTFKMAVPYKLN